MIETKIEKRWSLGIPHHPKSEELFEAIRKIDENNGDYFDWTCGGDGDNGEELMYALDIYFEQQEEKLHL
jgi:hypothetical protein